MQHCGETPAAAPLRVQLCGVLTAPFYDASVFVVQLSWYTVAVLGN